MERVQEQHGNTVVDMFRDRFNQETVIRSLRIGGMNRSHTIQHGPGKVTSPFRSSAKRVARGRVKSFNYDTETAFSSTFENDTKEGLNFLVKLTFSKPFFF